MAKKVVESGFEDNSKILQLIYGQVQLLRAEVQLNLEKRDEHLGRIDLKCESLDGRLKAVEKQCLDCPGKKALEKINNEEVTNKVKDSKEWKVGNFLLLIGTTSAIVLTILGILKYVAKVL